MGTAHHLVLRAALFGAPRFDRGTSHASVLPEIVTVNPNITVMMMGEKCVEMIREA